MVLVWDGLGLGFLHEESLGKVIVIEAAWNYLTHLGLLHHLKHFLASNTGMIVTMTARV